MDLHEAEESLTSCCICSYKAPDFQHLERHLIGKHSFVFEPTETETDEIGETFLSGIKSEPDFDEESNQGNASSGERTDLNKSNTSKATPPDLSNIQSSIEPTEPEMAEEIENDCPKDAETENQIIDSTTELGSEQFSQIQCEICDLRLTSQDILKSHREIDHQLFEQVGCQICGKTFSGKKNLSLHMKAHDGKSGNRNPKWACDLCSKVFTKEGRLTLHRIQAHGKSGETGLWNCDICGKEILLRASLKRHQRRAHHLKDEGGEIEKVERRDVVTEDAAAEESRDAETESETVTSEASGLNHPLKKTSKQPDAVLEVRSNSRPLDDRPKVSCEICGTSLLRNSLTLHRRRVHDRVDEQQCSLCGGKYYNKGILRSHLQVVHGVKEGLSECGLCQKTFSNSKFLDKHRTKFHGIDVLSAYVDKKPASRAEVLSASPQQDLGGSSSDSLDCQLCHKTFSNSKFLMKHKVKVHGTEVSSGNEKSASVAEATPASVIQHILSEPQTIASVSDSLECRLCQKIFSNSQFLEKHKIKVHATGGTSEDREATTGEEIVPSRPKTPETSDSLDRPICKICVKTFSSTMYLKSHMTKVHFKKRGLACEDGGQSLSTANALGKHRKAEHKIERPSFEGLPLETGPEVPNGPKRPRVEDREKANVSKSLSCELCQKVYSNSEFLKKHQSKVHSTKDQTTEQEPNLNQEASTESEPGHCCHLCSKSFTKLWILKRHVFAFHRRVAQYRCAFCETILSTKSSLMTHLEIEHGRKI